MGRLPYNIKIIAPVCAVCFALWSGTAYADNSVTRYYRQVKVVDANKQSLPSSGKGQFITFVNDKCYDSDKSGISVKNGLLEHLKTEDGKVYYNGYSYWGEALYIFTENYGRLNIFVYSSETTYVYRWETPPANVNTCSLIKENDTKPVPMPMLVPVPSPYPSQSPSSSSSPSPSPKQSEYGYVSCPQCHGSANCSSCGGDGLIDGYYTGGVNNIKCPSCTGGRCRSCNGSGQQYRRIR